jgi:NAD-dependent dihydropyrimidine dehydrogenase PreA subunit
MAYVIAQPCIGVKNAACVVVCPCDCIHPTKEESGFEAAEQLFIDPAPCIDCGLCAGECPAQAVFQQDDLPAEWSAFLEKNAAHYRK